jgi:hypothetical protein
MGSPNNEKILDGYVNESAATNEVAPDSTLAKNDAELAASFDGAGGVEPTTEVPAEVPAEPQPEVDQPAAE